MSKVGVVAIQGDFEKHAQAFARCGAEVAYVKTPSHLEGVDRIVIPGGESTTVGMLMQRFGLGDAIISSGLPVWGTCMGMILMADKIKGHEQYSLHLLDVTVERNAFGAQVHSFEDDITVKGIDTTVTGVFIRAPIIVEYGKEVEVLAVYDDKIVAVREGNRLGTSFHPELTDDTQLHEWFLKF